jgi:hypothetical protein
MLRATYRGAWSRSGPFCSQEPPDDCGGLDGYRDLVKTLSDPTHEEYAAMHEWAGTDFTPA